MLRRHPAKHELFMYAEGLADKRVAVSARMAGHVSSCPSCGAEVSRIRRSLEFLNDAPPLNPSPEFTAELLLRAKQERQATRRQQHRLQSIRMLTKGLVCASTLAAAAFFTFSAALNTTNPGEQTSAPARISDQVQVSSAASPELLTKTAAEVARLVEAVGAPRTKTPSLRERTQRRAVAVLGADISAALSALERNPGCVRASNHVDANLQRQARTLRALYVERSL